MPDDKPQPTIRAEASKAIEQHARLTATVAEAIARKSGFLADNILKAIYVEARQIVMRKRRRNGFEPPADDGEPQPP